MARHRREVVEPEIIQEGSDSDNEAKRRREDEESSESEEELDDEVCLFCDLYQNAYSKTNSHGHPLTKTSQNYLGISTGQSCKKI